MKTQYYIFDTYYRVADNTLRTSYVVAKDREQAEKLCKLRNIGEWINELPMPVKYSPQKINKLYGLPSKLFLLKDYLKCLHGIIHLGWIAEKSGTYAAHLILEDTGILHEIIHDMVYAIPQRDIKRIYKELKNFEKAIIGLYPKEY